MTKDREWGGPSRSVGRFFSQPASGAERSEGAGGPSQHIPDSLDSPAPQIQYPYTRSHPCTRVAASSTWSVSESVSGPIFIAELAAPILPSPDFYKYFNDFYIDTEYSGLPVNTQYKLYPQPSRAGTGLKGSALIYFPDGYDQGTERYPVLYWLHGGLANQRQGFWGVGLYHKAMTEGTMPKTIIVLVQVGEDWSIRREGCASLLSTIGTPCRLVRRFQGRLTSHSDDHDARSGRLHGLDLPHDRPTRGSLDRGVQHGRLRRPTPHLWPPGNLRRGVHDRWCAPQTT
jgi:hypothetical protein